MVPYRDRSPKTTQKSYGLKTKVYPKIPPTHAVYPLGKGNGVQQCDPRVRRVPCNVTFTYEIADIAHDYDGIQRRKHPIELA
jgi:hypothetical protein